MGECGTVTFQLTHSLCCSALSFWLPYSNVGHTRPVHAFFVHTSLTRCMCHTPYCTPSHAHSQLLPWALGGGILAPMDLANKLVQSVVDSMNRLGSYTPPDGLLLQNGPFGTLTDTIKSSFSG